MVTVLLVIGGILFSLIPIIIQEVYLLTTQLPNYFDEFISYFDSFLGYTISSQSLDLQSQFNSLIQNYGSTVGSRVVFAGQGLLRALGHIFIIFFS